MIVEQQHVLLIQRGQPPSEGLWTVPGGVIELGESPEEAVIREVFEECAVEVRVLGILAVVNRIVRDDAGVVKYHYVILDYVARCCHLGPGQALPDVIARAGTDVRAARWVPLEELSHYDVTEGLGAFIQAGIAMQAQFKQSDENGGKPECVEHTSRT